MSQAPYQPPTSASSPPITPTNTVGMIGFIISLIGLLLTCGLASPLGLLVSLFGLFKPPRGMAIAGTVLGLIGTGFLATVGLTIIGTVMAMVGLAKAVGTEFETDTAIGKAKATIESYQREHGKLPDGVEGNKLIIDLKDGWKNSLRYDYEQDSTSFLIRSAGEDGKFDTDDDRTSEDQPSITTTTPDIESGTLTPLTPEDSNPVPAPVPGATDPSEAPEPNP